MLHSCSVISFIPWPALQCFSISFVNNTIMITLRGVMVILQEHIDQDIKVWGVAVIT